MSDIQKLTVIGSGQMGAGIAQVAATSGLDVIMIDIKSEFIDNGMTIIEKSLKKFVEKGKLEENKAEAILERIGTSLNLESAATSDIVIEAVPEIEEIKFETFKNLDKICKKDTILASNTSSISITKIGDETKRPEKVIGMHFMNPVPMMKLVEIINGKKTTNETTNETVELAEKMGKVALTANDYPGFVSNRILCPMINEAIICLETGVASKTSIDGIMQLGMHHPMGPLALADLIGLDTVLHIMNTLYDGFKDEKYKASKMLEEMVEKGELGKKTGKGFYEY
ncbi:MAG: 3-hydroxybutyryl-CoA dehydrogenase [Marine Group III euryarchaeote CG-Bathy1]|uniref:3-hydroxybutyryl-CoA dehydrogenase n=1 Tax=Marine Group III euryarchaeote CG-Bathy1 TaxID=1889001 RepID=A0A1J5T2Z5_9ARCH|nr:MAG: 3-hydroxybutyryl-CoA dehydrogenase [Marine Group III euryarchaeote CG-Bathy1]